MRSDRLPPLWGAPTGSNRVIVSIVFGRSGLLTRAPYLFVAVAFVVAFGASLPLVQASISAPALPAIAAGGIAVAALIVIVVVRALTHRTHDLSGEVTGVTGLLDGERKTLTSERSHSDQRLRDAQEQRALIEKRLASLIRGIPGAVIWYEKSGVVAAADGSALATLFPGESIVGRTVQELKARHGNAEWNFRRAVAGEEFTAIEQLPELRVETRYIPLRDGTAIAGVLAISVDLRERDRLEHALRESDERARRIFEEMPLAAAFVGVDDRILLANRPFCDAVGLDAKQVSALTLGALTHPDEAEADRTIRERLLRGEIPAYRGAKRLIRKDGEILAFDATATVLRDVSGRPLYEIVMLKDASGRAHDEQVAAHFSRHDPTTDLPNRVAFDERLEQSITKMTGEKQRLGLVAFDVVNLGAISQRLGRAAADTVLRELARRVSSALSDADTLARIGRAQFALAVARRGAAGTAEMVEKLLTAVADGFAIDGQRIHADLRLGFAMYPEDAEDAEQLLRRAEAALHHAKRNDRRYIRYGDNVLV